MTLYISACFSCNAADSTVNVWELPDKIWTTIDFSVQGFNTLLKEKAKFPYVTQKLQWNICTENKLTNFIWDPLHNHNSPLITQTLTIKSPKHHFFYQVRCFAVESLCHISVCECLGVCVGVSLRVKWPPSLSPPAAETHWPVTPGCSDSTPALSGRIWDHN